MKRNSVTLLLVLMMVLSALALAGCQPASTSTTTAPTSTTAKPTAAPAPTEEPTEEPVELVWNMWYGDSATDSDFDLIQEKMNEYLLDNYNLTVDINVIQATDYEDRINVIINTGEYFDICFSASWLNFYDYARSGAFYAIEDLLPQAAPDLLTFIPEYIWDGTQVNGHNYCVPAYKDVCCAYFWFIDKGIMDKYDIDLNSLDGSLEAFEPVFELLQPKIDAGEEDLVLLPYDKNGHRVLNNEYSMFVNNVPLGIDVIANETTVTCPYENERILGTLATLHKYYEAGYIPAEAATTSSWEWGDTIRFTREPQGFPGMEFGQDPPVYLLQWTDGWTSTEWLTGSAQAISVNSNYPEQALTFLSALNLDAFVHNTAVFGVEDVHYTKVSDNHIEQTGDQRSACGFSAWTVGTFFDTLWTVNDEPLDKWSTVYDWIETNVYPLKINGFLYDPANVQDEIAAVTNVYAKYSAMLLTGTADPDEMVPEMMTELNDAGLQAIKDDMQTQLDAYMASK